MLDFGPTLALIIVVAPMAFVQNSYKLS